MNKFELNEKSRKELRTMRKKSKLTIEEVSAKLGKSRAWLGQIERGDLKTIQKNDLVELFKLYTDYPEEQIRYTDIIDNFIEEGILYTECPEAYNWYEEINFITNYFFEYFDKSASDEEVSDKLIYIHSLLRCLKDHSGATTLFLENFPLLERIFENYDELPADQYLSRFMKLTKKIQAILQEEINSTL